MNSVVASSGNRFRYAAPIALFALCFANGCGGGDSDTDTTGDAVDATDIVLDAPKDPGWTDPKSDPAPAETILEVADPGKEAEAGVEVTDVPLELPPDVTDIIPPSCQSDDDCTATMGATAPWSCSQWYCHLATGECFEGPLPDGTLCEPEDPCKTDGECKAGICLGRDMNCDDFNPCTDDSCDPSTGCVYANNTAPCQDGNPCTLTDACEGGQCVGTDNQCDCVEDADCADKEDGDLCNGTLGCVADKCGVDPLTEVVCDPSPDPCKNAVCNPATGQCTETPAGEGSPCDDGDACTLGDACYDGTCKGSEDQTCFDGNECTADSCHAELGCQFTAVDGPCDDGNLCTDGDQCVLGQCLGTPKAECNCIEDADCAQHEDGNPCNGTLVCFDNGCVLDPTTLVLCDTGLDTACLKTTCDPLSGDCVQSPAAEGEACDDADACTPTSECQEGACVALEPDLDCDDANECTDDWCDPSSGCEHDPNSGLCNDGDACTEYEYCQEGTCSFGSSVDCDDGNDCTDDSCDSSIGCVYTDNTAPCADAFCDGGDYYPAANCSQGTCPTQTPVDCDDGNVCTDDGCDPAQGCTTVNNLAECAVAYCESGDFYDAVVCADGSCPSQSAQVCDDDNVCTDDSCDPSAGCVNSDNTVMCAGAKCEQGSHYQAAWCVGGACPDPVSMSCDDDNDCTIDWCDPAQGCLKENQPVDCAGTWSDWGACSVECGGGIQSRTYTVTTPASCGGAACPDPLTEDQACNEQTCSCTSQPDPVPNGQWDCTVPVASGETCSLTCDIGTYATGDGEALCSEAAWTGMDACAPCETNCDKCTDATTCTACSAGYFLGGGDCTACEANCHTCTDATTCTGCSVGYFANGGDCAACEANCDTCTDATTCTSCSTTYFHDRAGLLDASVEYGTGNNPHSVAVGDLNGDLIPDLAVASRGSDTVSVLLGNGDGTFQAKVDYGTGDNPHSVAIGDLDGDTYPDLALTNAASYDVSVLLGNGDGTFQTRVDYGVGTDPQSVAIGDLNGDLKPDLAVANTLDNNVSVLLGNGDGTFQAKVDYGAGTKLRSVAIGDLNGDSKPDLTTANEGSNSTSVLLGNGDGTFQARVDYGVGSGPWSVAIGFLNGDPYPDLAVANEASHSVSVLLGNGDGTFQAKVDYGTGNNPYSVAIGDLDGDTYPDLALANTESHDVTELLGNGDGTFQAKVDYGTGNNPYSVAIGDLNGDTYPDLVSANRSSHNVSVLLNDWQCTACESNCDACTDATTCTDCSDGYTLSGGDCV